jgi:hypothetical protein
MNNETNKKAELKKRWSRNAVIISLLLHGGFVVVAVSIVAIHAIIKPTIDVTGELQKPKLERKKLELRTKPTQLQKSGARPRMTPRLVAKAPSSVPLPTINVPPRDPTMKLSRGMSIGRGMGTGMWGGLGPGSGGTGLGGIGVKLPPLLSGRCTPQERFKLLKKNGAGPEVDQAITRALDWFNANQNDDGSWGKEGMHQTAMTGLALLAFMARCETDKSSQYGQTVARAIEYLVKLGRNNDGRLWTPDKEGKIPEQAVMTSPYEHAIATLALSEAFSITKRPEIKSILDKSVEIIIKGQNKQNFGWAYNYGTAGNMDLSVTGWQVQALKAALLAEVKVPGLDQAFHNAVETVQEIQAEDGSFPYGTGGRNKDGKRPPKANSSLTGTGLLSALLDPKNKPSGELVKDAVDHILENHQVDYKAQTANLYAWYYDTYAMFLANDRWTLWNNMFREQLLTHQDNDGSWPPTGGAGHWYVGSGSKDDKSLQVYRTALCTLMLEVYYRYLPSAG